MRTRTQQLMNVIADELERQLENDGGQVHTRRDRDGNVSELTINMKIDVYTLAETVLLAVGDLE